MEPSPEQNQDKQDLTIKDNFQGDIQQKEKNEQNEKTEDIITPLQIESPDIDLNSPSILQRELEDKITQKITQKTKKNKECTLKEFFTKKRHYLIMTEGGKPVYSRYGDEIENCGIFATLSAMITKFTVFVSTEENKEQLNYISNEDHLIVFKKISQLFFIAYSKKGDSISLLSSQLDYLFHQLMSILTIHFFEKVEDNPSQCLTAMSDTELLFENMIRFTSKTHCSLFNAYSVMPIEGRNKIQSICDDNRGEALLCIILSSYDIIAISHMESIAVVPSDIILLQNLILSSMSLRRTESWVPLCLPGISQEGYLQLYCKFSEENVGICFITESVESNLFLKFTEQYENLYQTLLKEGHINKIMEMKKEVEIAVEEGKEEEMSDDLLIEELLRKLEDSVSRNESDLNRQSKIFIENFQQKISRSMTVIPKGKFFESGKTAIESIIFGVCKNIKMNQYFLINMNHNFNKLNEEERNLIKEYNSLFDKLNEMTKEETKEKDFLHIEKGEAFTNAVLQNENFILMASFNFFLEIDEVGKHMKESIKFIKSKESSYFIIFK